MLHLLLRHQKLHSLTPIWIQKWIIVTAFLQCIPKENLEKPFPFAMNTSLPLLDQALQNKSLGRGFFSKRTMAFGDISLWDVSSVTNMANLFLDDSQ